MRLKDIKFSLNDLKHVELDFKGERMMNYLLRSGYCASVVQESYPMVRIPNGFFWHQTRSSP